MIEHGLVLVGGLVVGWVLRGYADARLKRTAAIREVLKIHDEYHDPDAPAGEEHMQEVGPRKEFHNN